MNINEFNNELRKKAKEINDLVHRRLPIIAGATAQSHFKENFRKGGFVDNGLQKWKKSNRELHGGMSASSNYGTLLSARNHLYTD